MTAALMREHLCLPGMSSSTAKTFRDKYRDGRCTRKRRDRTVPEFVPLINPDEVREFMERVPPPWIIKPRSDVSAIGIRKVERAGRSVARDRRNERARESARACVLLFAGAVCCRRSLSRRFGRQRRPGRVCGRESVWTSADGSGASGRRLHFANCGAWFGEREELLAINRKLVKALELERGATHAEFIKSDADGQFYFLEIAARVGGAYIADVLGSSIRAESLARVGADGSRRQAAGAAGAGEGAEAIDGSNKLKPLRNEYAGIVLSLSKQENPDTSAYDDPEIVYRVKKHHHAGLIVRSKSLNPGWKNYSARGYPAPVSCNCQYQPLVEGGVTAVEILDILSNEEYSRAGSH